MRMIDADANAVLRFDIVGWVFQIFFLLLPPLFGCIFHRHNQFSRVFVMSKSPSQLRLRRCENFHTCICDMGWLCEGLTE